MDIVAEKPNPIQKPFRCPVELEARLNRAKGALMLRTGTRISDNQFVLNLLELGLEVMLKQIDNGDHDPRK